MDYVKEAENYLRHYASLKKSVEHAQYMIERLTYKSRPRKVGAVQNDVTGVAAQCPGNTLQEMYELQRWQEVYEESLREIEHIGEMLDSISRSQDTKRYRDVLEMWYVERMDKADIATELGWSERSIYRLKENAIKDFARALFGFLAIKAM